MREIIKRVAVGVTTAGDARELEAGLYALREFFRFTPPQELRRFRDAHPHEYAVLKRVFGLVIWG